MCAYYKTIFYTDSPKIMSENLLKIYYTVAKLRKTLLFEIFSQILKTQQITKNEIPRYYEIYIVIKTKRVLLINWNYETFFISNPQLFKTTSKDEDSVFHTEYSTNILWLYFYKYFLAKSASVLADVSFVM